MAPHSNRTSKPTLRSTDRGGIVSITAGVIALALGFGMQIGITLQTSSHTVVALKDMAMGLGGMLYPAVPFLMLWLGWLLCVSARHYISFRAFVLTFLLFMSLGAFLILITSVPGFGPLMEYLTNVNKNMLKLAEPDSFGSFLSHAWNKYRNQLSPLPGGGVIGMLLAFPVWRLLGQVGGIVFLALAMIALVFALLRINPAAILRSMDKRLQQRSPDTPVPAQGEGTPQPVAEPLVQQPSEMQTQEPMPYQPQVEPYYVEPAVDYEPQPVYPQPLWQQSVAPVMEQSPEQQGFVSVQQDYFEPSEPAPHVRPVARNTRRTQREPAVTPQAEMDAPNHHVPQHPVADQSYEDGAPGMPDSIATSAAQSPAAQPRSAVIDVSPQQTPVPVERPAAPTPVAPQPMEEKAIDQRAVPTEPAEVTPQLRETRQPRPGPIRDVGTAAAVPLTGERVRVEQIRSLPEEQRRLDGTAKPRKPQEKQIALMLDSYARPPANLLSVPAPNENGDTTEEDYKRAEKLISTLSSFNITATVQQIVHGPAITRFAIRLAEGVNVNRLRNVMDNIAVELLAKSPVRAEIPIPGTPLIGIEVSNDKATTVYLSEVLHSPKMQELRSPTAVALGKDITGAPVICELMDMPHLLIAGATGSGKSVCINSIITSLLYRATPRDLRLILIDPKFVELQPYNDIPHLLLPVVVDPKKAVAALEWVCIEMDERYQKLQQMAVRNIDAYNKKLAPDEEPMSKIVVIVDEMSDLMASAGKVIDEHVKRITAKARAAGICLILATQRPSVDVITGIIKANIPSRIAFQVSSQIDSRTILDSQGAEKLLGYGDMLYLPRNLSSPRRVQGCFVSDKEVSAVADFVKSRNNADYNVDIMEHVEKGDKADSGNGAGGAAGSEDADAFDELLPQAIEMAVEAGQMSISMLQRVLRVGYGRAGRLIDEMARRNIISGNEGTKARKTLITREEYMQLFDKDDPF